MKEDGDELFNAAIGDAERAFKKTYKLLVKRWVKKIGRANTKEAVYEGLKYAMDDVSA